MPKQLRPDERVWLLDEARGLFILLMVLYHLVYDLIYLFGLEIPAFHWSWIVYAQLLVAGLFLFISGIVSHYARSNARRGLWCFACGLLMTVGTLLVLPDQAVWFGVLHLLGSCMLLFALLRGPLRRVPPLAGLLTCAFLFVLTYHTQAGYWGMGGWTIPLPRVLYGTDFLFFLGLPSAGFWSSDYFPLFPWMFWFFAGAFAGVFVREKRCPAWIYRPHCRPLAMVGRHTLLIYLLHQPILYFLLTALREGIS